MEGHEGYKRGVATARQDKTSLVHNSSKVTVVEPSEEVRLMLCNLISALLKSGVGYGSLQHLNPYFSDLVLILQSQLRDPFPQLKVRSREERTTTTRSEATSMSLSFLALRTL